MGVVQRSERLFRVHSKGAVIYHKEGKGVEGIFITADRFCDAMKDLEMDLFKKSGAPVMNNSVYEIVISEERSIYVWFKDYNVWIGSSIVEWDEEMPVQEPVVTASNLQAKDLYVSSVVTSLAHFCKNKEAADLSLKYADAIDNRPNGVDDEAYKGMLGKIAGRLKVLVANPTKRGRPPKKVD